uniref:MyTH4 domain-containing protein n=1 Tax=Hucho hucho TaxID=62062 RepID=A0A4W5RLN0_9TELE
MSCTFLPGPAVLKYLRFHLKRIQSQFPDSEMDNYASFIGEALEKTRCRECVPSWEEIQVLMGRQEMLCTVHYPGPGSCQLHISSHTTANEVRGDLSIISVSLSLCLYQDLRTPSPILSILVDLCGDLHCKVLSLLPTRPSKLGTACQCTPQDSLSLSSARW